MNKKRLYPVLLSVLVITVIFIVARSNKSGKEPVSYQLKERKGLLANSDEYVRTRAKAANLRMAVREDPDDIKSLLALAAIYIQEARITGDHMYYDAAAMQQADHVLQIDAGNFEALTYKAIINLSQHHFAEGMAIAEKAKSINPYNAFIYGVLVDANVEMGDYKKAVEYADSMVSLRPDLRSYSRISYLREIHGDYPGAIEAMKLALDAGMYGDEATEWVRVQLAHLYEKTGDLKSAEMHYVLALESRPGYAYALAGLASIAMANRDHTTAIQYLLKADSTVADYAFKEDLVDAYRQAGQNDKADILAQKVIEEMNKDAGAGIKDENTGHYADRELAYAYLKINNTDKALEHALIEYNRRPENIDVNETVAWVYYNQAKAGKALPYLEQALKTNCRNPVLLNRAGLIYAKAGNGVKAKAFLEQGLKSNANIASDLKAESMLALRSL